MFDLCENCVCLLHLNCKAVLLQLSDNDDDDDDDISLTNVDTVSESDYHLSNYLRHPDGFVSHQKPSNWHSGRNNYVSSVKTSRGYYMMIITHVFIFV